MTLSNKEDMVVNLSKQFLTGGDYDDSVMLRNCAINTLTESASQTITVGAQ